jgi:hypothetical protein
LGDSYVTLMEESVLSAADELGIELPHSRVVTLLLVGMLNDMYRWFVPQGRLSVDDIAHALAVLFLHGVRGPATPSGSGARSSSPRRRGATDP